MLSSIILYLFEKKRVWWQNQEWKRKHEVWRETPYSFMLLLFEYRDVLYKINRFSLISKDGVAFWRKALSKSPDAFKVLSLNLFWVYSPFRLSTQNTKLDFQICHYSVSSSLPLEAWCYSYIWQKVIEMMYLAQILVTRWKKDSLAFNFLLSPSRKVGIRVRFDHKICLIV